jgi:hypothetical protein
MRGRFHVHALSGRRAYVSGGLGPFTIVDTEAGSILKQSGIPAIAGDFAISPDGARIAVGPDTGERSNVLRASDLRTSGKPTSARQHPVTIPGELPETEGSSAGCHSDQGARAHLVVRVAGIRRRYPPTEA